MREYEIHPEPEPAEAAAIAEALERLAADDGWDAAPGPAASPWSRAARAEAVGDDP
jgi:hypothetical protein